MAIGLPVTSLPLCHGAKLVRPNLQFLMFPKFVNTLFTLTLICFLFAADGSVFTQDIKTVHVRDLNFVLRSEIFVLRDGQLRASHLILGVDLVYSTWQLFSQALIVDSPLLSYIDVRHVNFLPPPQHYCRRSPRPRPTVYLFG